MGSEIYKFRKGGCFMKVGSLKSVRWGLVFNNVSWMVFGFLLGMISMFFIINNILSASGLKLLQELSTDSL